MRVSLDGTLNIGEAPALLSTTTTACHSKFTGTLNRVVIRLAEGQLTAEDEEQIRRAKAAISLSQ